MQDIQELKTISLNKAIQDIGQKVVDVAKLAKEALLNPFEKVEKPPSILEIDNITYGTLGNFSVLNGKAKSRKSFLATILFISGLDNNNFVYKPRITNKQPYKNAIYFDTEQSDWHVHRIADRIIRKTEAKEGKEHFKIYRLRKHTPAERIQIIEHILYNSKNLGLVVIDGIADLISNGYNDEADAIKLTSKLMKWSDELNIHIIGVVHQNKGDNHAKGHLGSYLMQKAETVIDVERCKENKDYSIATPSYSRGIDVEPIYYTIDEKGIPIITGEPDALKRSKKLKYPQDFERSYKQQMIQKVFQKEPTMTYTQVWNKIKLYYAEEGHRFGDNIAKEWFTYYKELSIIIQNENKEWKLNTVLFDTGDVVF